MLPSFSSIISYIILIFNRFYHRLRCFRPYDKSGKEKLEGAGITFRMKTDPLAYHSLVQSAPSLRKTKQSLYEMIELPQGIFIVFVTGVTRSPGTLQSADNVSHTCSEETLAFQVTCSFFSSLVWFIDYIIFEWLLISC